MAVLKVLIAEDEEYLREYLEFLIRQQVEADVHSVGSGRAAIGALEQDSFDAVVCDYNMPNGDGAEVLKYIRDRRLPIRFILCSTEVPSLHKNLDPAHIYGNVVKPDVGKPLCKILNQLKSELQRAKIPRAAAEADFVRVPASVVASLIVSPIDVYQKLTPTSFLKIIENQDLATSRELREYMARGATHFYIEKKYAEELIKNYQNLVANQFALRNLTIEQTVDYLQATSEVVRELAERLGWSPELKEMVNLNINLVVKQAEERRELALHLRRFSPKDGAYLGAHSALVAYVTIGLTQELGWEAVDLHYKLALAAFLHDLTLTDNEILNLQDYMNEIAKGRTYPWLESMRNHPLRAARLLDDWPNVPQGTALIVQQHHERADGKGFPNGLSHEKILPLSALFIVAEDLVNQLLSRSAEGLSGNFQDFIDSRHRDYSAGSFQAVFSVLRALASGFTSSAGNL